MKNSKGIMALGPVAPTPISTKGVYRLNPTRAIMKSGSQKARKAVTEDVPGFRKVPKLKQPNKAKRKTK